MSRIPLGYLDSAGARAAATLPLTWFLLLVSIAVCLAITYLLWRALRGPAGTIGADGKAPAVRRGEGAARPILVGVAISSVILLIALGWTMVALAQVAPMPRRPEIEIDVTAHQWWWQADYGASEPDQTFSTANEIHVPVGAKVLLRLHGADVIHSFWVPKLTGKTDMIPGQVNLTWLQADKPGVYRGQCQEYCGLQHAHMAFEVVAEPPAQYAAWRRAQLQTAPPPATPAQAEGLALVEYRCAVCHTVRGTTAGSNVGPDLTHVMSRRMLAAGTLPNNRAMLAGWIEDPQGVKPGTLMPAQQLSGPQLQALLAYLETLK
ncbi:MAG: cytochrome c oxidase subunit II [Altererythrobacter sp.]|nr:cytochrome c oxidase subunit II [Altererythrobacter sp.]OJU60864.1 MAG: cytochrome c oxidase subunit II [Altererythrobacter sp. 66-12]